MWDCAKGLLFTAAVLYGSITDIRSRDVPPAVPILIFLAGLLDFSPALSLTGLLLMGLVFFCAALAGFGGGDFWLMAACGFLLGPWGGILQTITGLSLALLYAALRRLVRGRPAQRETIPLVPFLGIGGIFAFLSKATGGCL